ncbi:hypothetical protein [Robiginitalea aurantiaca]|uniref:Lipocalin-like domain-containing protein n=1 Tax=Robiginitalea aurantiaca TaxID=3056915 RepID=A0ABT7WCM6_9FLAO|nr:hypothetical protein [Robiginitalea aurantiaca]MDM9630653.1 hypothetical protein [Robiginitalea aurantiaca]
MKKLYGILLLAVVVLTTAAVRPPTPDTMHSLEGTWELRSFYNYDGENIQDTVELVPGYRQVKMYYNGRVMWSRTDPNDTIGRFGYGSYRITTDELIEVIEYGDHYMMEALDTIRQFSFELKIQGDTYSQITLDEDGQRTFSENYNRVK